MNGRTIFLIVLGMSASFSLILGVMMILINPTPPKTKSLSRSQPQQTAPKRQAKTPTTSTRAPALVPITHPSNLTQQSQSDSMTQLADAAASLATQEISLIKKSLGNQIDELKKDRDAKLSALARELALMPPPNAAAQLDHLDDEAAALTLAKMPADKRTQVLKATDKQRAARLANRLKKIR